MKNNNIFIRSNDEHRDSRDSIEDLKAAFVCVNNGIDGHFASADDLAKG
jgi:hypothetical protein